VRYTPWRPTAAEVPPIDLLVTQDAPSPGNPLGAKGAGEGGVSAAGAAIASAVRDALGLPGSVGRLPLTPARVRALAQSPTTRRCDTERPLARPMSRRRDRARGAARPAAPETNAGGNPCDLPR
jgi:hypothetical protein